MKTLTAEGTGRHWATYSSSLLLLLTISSFVGAEVMKTVVKIPVG